MQDTYIGDEGNGFPLVLVHGFLGSSDKPTPISDKEIQRILGQVSESAINQKSGIGTFHSRSCFN